MVRLIPSTAMFPVIYRFIFISKSHHIHTYVENYLLPKKTQNELRSHRRAIDIFSRFLSNTYDKDYNLVI